MVKVSFPYEEPFKRETADGFTQLVIWQQLHMVYGLSGFKIGERIFELEVIEGTSGNSQLLERDYGHELNEITQESRSQRSGWQLTAPVN